LTISINKIDGKRLDKTLLYEDYKELTKQLDKINDNPDLDVVKEVKQYVDAFNFNNLFHFKGETKNKIFQERMAVLSVSLLMIELEIEAQKEIDFDSVKIELDDQFAKKLFDVFQDKLIPSRLSERINSFRLDKQTALGFIQRVLTDGDIKPYYDENLKKLKEKISA
jgi:hypothetical protein